MQNRAYSILDIKAVDERERTIRGIATTPTVDRVGDIIEPEGVKFDNPMPFLWQHNHDQPIGTVEFSDPTKNGVRFEAKLPVISEEGTLRDRIEEAWQTIKAGLVRAVSIGFRPVEYAFMDNGGIRYSEVEVYELSAVTIPANADCLITQVKSIDAALRKAAGIPDPEIPMPEPDAIAPGHWQTNQIPAPPEPAASGKGHVVVRLDDPAGVSAPPFIIREVKPLGRLRAG